MIYFILRIANEAGVAIAQGSSMVRLGVEHALHFEVKNFGRTL